jgi:hypothetical protein
MSPYTALNTDLRRLNRKIRLCQMSLLGIINPCVRVLRTLSISHFFYYLFKEGPITFLVSPAEGLCHNYGCDYLLNDYKAGVQRFCCLIVGADRERVCACVRPIQLQKSHLSQTRHVFIHPPLHSQLCTRFQTGPEGGVYPGVCVCTRICTLGRSRAGRGVEMDRFIHRRVSAGWRGIANGDKVELKHAPAPYVISVGCVCADSFTQQ